MRVRLSFFFYAFNFPPLQKSWRRDRGAPSLAEAWRLRQGGRPKAFLRQVAARRRRLLSSWSFFISTHNSPSLPPLLPALLPLPLPLRSNHYALHQLSGPLGALPRRGGLRGRGC